MKRRTWIKTNKKQMQKVHEEEKSVIFLHQQQLSFDVWLIKESQQTIQNCMQLGRDVYKS